MRHIPVTSEDGFSVSIQAHSGAYCSPRRDNPLFGYVEVEFGYPSSEEELLMPHSELSGEGVDYTKQIYPYAPANLIKDLIEKHGPIVSGTYPKINDRPNRVWVDVESWDNGLGSITTYQLSEFENRYERHVQFSRAKKYTFPEYLERQTREIKELSQEQWSRLKSFIKEL